MRADLVLFDGYFFSPEHGDYVAEAVAVKDGAILAMGDEEDVRRFLGPRTHVIDLEGRAVLPGLSDSHVHGLALGRSLGWADLSHTSSIQELVEELRERLKGLRADEWLIGFGWDHERFRERRLPTRKDLDFVSTEKPIVLFRKCWHLCVVNSTVLGLMEPDEVEELLSRGLIIPEPGTGEPSGIFLEDAVDLVRRLMPKPSKAGVLGAVERAIGEALSKGLTCLHWIVECPEELSVIMALRAAGRLGIRLYLLFPVWMLEHLLFLGLRTGFGDPWVRIGAVKLVLDGSLGARTAFLREPYSDAPGERGKLLYGEGELRELALKAHEAGLQLAIHAIGDGAVELALKVLSELPGGPGRMRHRLEHASVLDPGLIEAMARLGVVASVQPRFVVSDFWVEERLGASRARWAYPFRSMLRAGVVLAAGSDAPIEPIDPFEGIAGAVGEAQREEERIGFWDAVRAYTLGAAYASFQEGFYGSLGPGKAADFTVLSCGPDELGPDAVGEVDVDATFVLGRLAYSRVELAEFR